MSFSRHAFRRIRGRSLFPVSATGFERAKPDSQIQDSNPKEQDMTEESTQSGLSDTAASGLAYITIIPAIVFLVVAPYNQNSTIRFHAWQSIFLGIAWFAISLVAIIPILGWLVFAVGSLTLFVVWIMCILKAFQGGKFVVPVLGPLAAKQAGI
jgi:uncharacterized membrane protein